MPIELPKSETPKNGDACFMRLRDGTIGIPGKTPPAEWHVKGSWADDHFVPGKVVDGEGALADKGTPGWMELNNGKFFGAMTARKPFSPYVQGFMTDSGFVPSSRDVR